MRAPVLRPEILHSAAPDHFLEMARNLARYHREPAALREDLAGPRTSPALLHSACDLIDHGSDLASESAALVHENERRWRVFRQRIDQLVDADE